MLAKILKVTGLTVLGLFVLLLVLPFLFRGKIIEMVKKTASDYLDAKIEFSDLSLSFIRNFPNASITIDDFYIVGVDTFAQDTLAKFDRFRVVADIKSVFGDQILVKRVLLNHPQVRAKVLADGRANWDIVKPSDSDGDDDETTEQDSASAFGLKLEQLSIEHAYIYYNDRAADIDAALEELNFTLRGDMTQNVTNLDIRTEIDSVTVAMEGIPYLKKANAEARATVQADLENMKFTFGDNMLRLNAIVLNFAGWLALPDDGIDMDVTLNAPETKFKDLLSMVPAVYAKDFESIETRGKISLDAFAKGQLRDSIFPNFDVKLNVADAYFKYPDLPASVDNINISAEVSNPGGDLDLTEVSVPNFQFQIGENPFKIYFYAKNLLSDIYLKAGAKGVLNLGTVKDFYPLDEGMSLSGILTADLDLEGRMSYIEREEFDKFAAAGTLELSNALYKSLDLPDVQIDGIKLAFTSKYLGLEKCDLQIANTDIHAKGTLENFIAYVLREETIKGMLNLWSSQINANDFLGEETETAEAETPAGNEASAEQEAAETEPFSLPKNIDFTMQADLKKILYDKIVIENLNGIITLKNGVLSLPKAGMEAFGGKMTMNAELDASDEKESKVSADINVQNLVFTEVCKQLDMVQQYAPIFENVTGVFNGKIAGFTATLGADLTPDYPSINAKGELSSGNVSVSNLKVLDILAKTLNKDDLKTINAKDLKIAFEIKDGRLYTSPFDVKMGNTSMNISGSTGLDQTIDYVAKVTIPQNMTSIPMKVEALIGGTFSSPKVKLGAKETLNAVKDAAKEKAGEAVEKLLAEAQKQKEQLVAEAQKAGEKLVDEAQKAGDKLVEAAQKEADKGVEQAKNPLAKAAAKKAGEAAVKAAQKKSDDLVKAAQKQSDSLVKTAGEQGDKLIESVRNKKDAAL